jgi:SiaC family regulatory phosphoprotein
MRDLIIEPTRKTPEIVFKSNGELYLNGISLPQNVIDFFMPVFSWLEELKTQSPQNIRFVIDLVYLDTSSTKAILSMLKLLKKIVPGEEDLEIVWKYEHGDMDMLDQGEVLQRTTKIPFRFEEIDE